MNDQLCKAESRLYNTTVDIQIKEQTDKDNPEQQPFNGSTIYLNSVKYYPKGEV